jgi:hypothetical protein
MAVTVKHRFVSAKVDTLDNSRVQPSNWNDTHAIQCAGGVVLGRTAGAGQADVTELPLGATGQAILATATAAAARAAISADDSLTTINAAALKATPVDTDWFSSIDSAAGNIFKRVTWANIKATLKTYFDTLYPSNVNGIFSGSVTALSSFISSTTTAILAATGAAGTVLLRPNGVGNAAGQASLNSAGDLNLSGVVNATDLRKNGNSVDAQLAKAWVSWTVAGGVVSVRNSYNVASVVRNSNGVYTINFTTPMANANYTIQATSSTGSESWAMCPINAGDVLAGSVKVWNRQAGGIGPADVAYASLTVYNT